MFQSSGLGTSFDPTIQLVPLYLPALAPLKINRKNTFWLIIPVWLLQHCQSEKAICLISWTMIYCAWWDCECIASYSPVGCVLNTLLLSPTHRVPTILSSDDPLLYRQVIYRALGQGKELSFFDVIFYPLSLSAWNPDETQDLTFLLRYTVVLPLTDNDGVAGLDFKRMWTPMICHKFNWEKKCTAPCWHKVQPTVQ